MTFTDLKLHPSLLKAIEEQNYTNPTPIQAQSIPQILEGHDLIGCAQTGTGKTASYVLPILNMLLDAKDNAKVVTALVVVPTRELVQQVCENITKYAAHTNIKHVPIYGGASPVNQIKNLKIRPNIIVATPGRLIDFLNNKHIDLKNLKHFVLDEADQMLDMGFVKDIKKIISFLPQTKQTLLLSATMPKEIHAFAKTIQKNPREVTIERVSSTVKTVTQSIVFTDQKNKAKVLEQLIKSDEKSKCIVFVRTKHGADKLVIQLLKQGVESIAIHGNKSQNYRNNALSSFKNNTMKVLIATDIAARGIDIEQLPLVVNYDLPNIPETYVHRIGRTGRAGHSGKAITLCAPEENKELQSIQKLIGNKIPLEPAFQ